MPHHRLYYLNPVCRQVLVTILRVPERVDWKACITTEEADKTDVENFKKAFAVFSPSL